MPRRILVLLMLFVLVPGAKLRAQTYRCASATSDDAVNMREYMVSLVTATTDTSLVAMRTTYHLPALDSSKVSIVTTAKTCASAAIAYNKAIHGPDASAVSRTIVVVKIGTTRYALLDPLERYGEYEINVITDSNFVVLNTFSG
jgi:hypothetical protein